MTGNNVIYGQQSWELKGWNMYNKHVSVIMNLLYILYIIIAAYASML